MSKLDLTRIREILMDEQKTLAADIQKVETNLQQDLEENVFSRLSLMNQRLTQVQAALKRFDEGKYGLCAKCNTHINPERLKAIPYAALCVSCQARFERANR